MGLWSIVISDTIYRLFNCLSGIVRTKMRFIAFAELVVSRFSVNGIGMCNAHTGVCVAILIGIFPMLMVFNGYQLLCHPSILTWETCLSPASNSETRMCQDTNIIVWSSHTFQSNNSPKSINFVRSLKRS